MIPTRAAGCLAVLCLGLVASAARAEISGQERAQAAGRAIVGAAAPRTVLHTIDGQSIDLGDLYGKKAVYLKFWATWCAPCREQMPHFEHAYETAGEGLAVIAIDVGFNDSIEAIRTYRKQLGITMPIVFDDGNLANAFHLRVTPTHIVIGRDGRIQYVGHLADARLDAALNAARAPAAFAGARGGHAKALRSREDAPAVEIGGLVPQLAVRTIDGRRFELRGDPSPRQITVLVFISPWCESYLATTRPEVSKNCRDVRLQVGALAEDSRVRWLGIASGLWANRDDLRHYKSEYDVRIPLTLDESGGVFRAFRVNNVPTVFIADAHGRLLRRLEGGESQNAAAIRNAVDGL